MSRDDATAFQPGQQEQNSLKKKKRKNYWLGMVAHVCNPSSLGGRDRWISSGQEFKTSLANMVKPHLYKNTKKNQPVIPATQETEVGELL